MTEITAGSRLRFPADFRTGYTGEVLIPEGTLATVQRVESKTKPVNKIDTFIAEMLGQPSPEPTTEDYAYVKLDGFEDEQADLPPEGFMWPVRFFEGAAVA